MTKEVLVSISGKHIDIMNDPTAGYETGDDDIEVVTPANYYCKNGKHYRSLAVKRTRPQSCLIIYSLYQNKMSNSM